MDSALFTQLANDFYSLSLIDGVTIATLAVLEGILSVDNALVLAILVRTLPPPQRKKALMYGIIGAFVFRFLALIFAGYLMRFVVFKLIGGAYLIYLAMKHMFFFYKEDALHPTTRVEGSFWKTVALVEMTDIAFSIDSITTAVAMSDKLLIVWIGGILGIVFLRFLSTFFVKLLERLPRLEDLAYQLIFFIGAKLTLESFHVEIEQGIFWMMMGIIVVIGAGLTWRDYHQRKTKTKYHNRLLDRLDKGEVTAQELLELEYIPREVIRYLKENNCLRLRIPPPGEPCDAGAEER